MEQTQIYTAYAERNDITFIMKDSYDENGDVATTEVVGWHYGKPNRKITPNYIGELTTTY